MSVRVIAEYRSLTSTEQLSVLFLLTIITLAISAPISAPASPTQENYDDSLSPPSAEYPLGTDLTGRDVLSRLIFGARISLLVGALAVSLAVGIGVPIGSVAGFFGGWIDNIFMRTMDIILAFPALVLALALVGTLGPSLFNLILIIGVVYAPQYARLIRGEVLSVKEEEFVEAAENTGLGEIQILIKHIIPNALAPIIVQSSFHIATAIIFESSLSFLGLGIQPPTPTWGIMIANGRNYLPEAWWISTFAGVAISITVLSFNILGDALQDRFDPRSEVTGGPDT